MRYLYILGSGDGNIENRSWGPGRTEKRIPDFPWSENGGGDAGWGLGRGSVETQAEGGTGEDHRTELWPETYSWGLASWTWGQDPCGNLAGNEDQEHEWWLLIKATFGVKKLKFGDIAPVNRAGHITCKVRTGIRAKVPLTVEVRSQSEIWTPPWRPWAALQGM